MRRRWLLVLPLAAAACDRPNAPAPAPTPSASPSAAVAPTPVARQTCPPWKPRFQDELAGLSRAGPLPIPVEFRDIASADRTTMTVQGLAGTPVCVKLISVEEASNFRLSADKRFLEFDYNGYELSGHRLVDRAGAGSDIETGIEPVFSKDRTMFASAQLSEATMGGLEAIAVWQVRDRDVVRMALNASDLPQGFAPEEWEVSKVGPGPCVELSTLPKEVAAKLQEQGVEAQNKAAAGGEGRVSFRWAPEGGKWKFTKIESGEACPG